MSMTLFFVVNGGRREPVQISPMSMAKLQDLVEQQVLVKINSRKKQNTGGAPSSSSSSSSSSYKVYLKKKELDCTLPIRFSGLKDRETLDLVLNTTNGFSSAAGAGAGAGARVTKEPSSSSASKLVTPPSSSQHKPKPPETSARQQAGQTLAANTSTGRIGGLAEKHFGATDRKLIVFHEDIVKASGAGNGNGSDDLPEDFYEFTAQDFAKIQQGHSQQAKEDEAKTLQTRAMREKARLEKAKGMAPVRLRVVLQDGWCLQCVFRATEKVEDIYRFVSGLVDLPVSSFELFTTPPKSILSKTSNETLYDANLVPSAKIYFTGAKGKMHSTDKFLSKDVVQRYSVHTADQVNTHGKPAAPSSSNSNGKINQNSSNIGSGGVSNTNEKSSSQGGGQAKAKKSSLPKWFKGGK